MISSDLPCPDEADLVALVDGDLAREREDAVITHLALCADCRGLLGRTEAALRYALGGIADGEMVGDAESTPEPVGPRAALPRRPWLRLSAPLAAAAAIVVAVALAQNDTGERAWTTRGPQPAAAQTLETAGRDAAQPITQSSDAHIDAQLNELLARTRRVRADAALDATAEEEDLLAGLLAAREARESVAASWSER